MSLSVSLMMAALLLGVAATPATAERRGPGKRGQAGLQDIDIEPGVGNGSRTVMRIAVRPDGGLYVAVAGSWQFVEEGKSYRMKFVFGNGRVYEEELKTAAVGSEIVLVKPRMNAAAIRRVSPCCCRTPTTASPSSGLATLLLLECRIPAIRPSVEASFASPVPP
jgi:hypothetical protein